VPAAMRVDKAVMERYNRIYAPERGGLYSPLRNGSLK